MNTVKVGDAFEAIAAKIIEHAIEQRSLGISDNIKIFAKKKYSNGIRDIVFDLSIEVWPRGASNYALLYLIECKYYTDKIPVDDVEEFIFKMRSAGAHKGIFITNKGFQKGSLLTAKATGVMLIRGETASDYEIVMHRTNINISDQKVPLVEGVLSIEDQAVILLSKIIDEAILSAFRQVENPQPLFDDYNIKNLSREDIEKMALEELKKFLPEVWDDGRGVSVSKLRAYITQVLGVRIEPLEEYTGIQGTCDPRNKIIQILPSLVGTKRELFVLAHELAHYILHADLTIEQEAYDSFSDPVKNFITNRYELANPRNWIEWQANCFASALIMPNFAVIVRLNMYLGDEGLGAGLTLYLDDQPQNMRTATKIINKLSNFFNVTNTTIRYRLEGLNKFKNGSRVKSIGQLISDMNDDIF